LEQAKKIMDSIRASQHKQLIFQIFMNLSIHALAEKTHRFQKHPITPLGEKVSFLSKENVCFMKLLHNTYISKQKKTPNSFMSIKNIFSYYEASSYKHKQKPQSNQAILAQNSLMIPTQQKTTTT
jgi:hypothetical protein